MHFYRNLEKGKHPLLVLKRKRGLMNHESWWSRGRVSPIWCSGNAIHMDFKGSWQVITITQPEAISDTVWEWWPVLGAPGLILQVLICVTKEGHSPLLHKANYPMYDCSTNLVLFKLGSQQWLWSSKYWINPAVAVSIIIERFYRIPTWWTLCWEGGLQLHCR